MFHFTIEGKPKPQKQTSFSKGRFYDPSYQDKKVIQSIANQYKPSVPFREACTMKAFFYFVPPKSLSTPKYFDRLNHPHIIKPDVDNLGYLITNSLKKMFYEDDSQITDLYLAKRWGPENKTVVTIEPYHELNYPSIHKHAHLL